ncbi:MAG TPA: hypothetical protein VEV20_01850 [Burkholderiales bacterium]|nr:hypothetical protein [Burkholderiales bacterium]
MDDEQHRWQVERLREEFAEVTARKTALLDHMREFAGHIHEVRAVLGNPFFYSGENWHRPENADESVANYTGYRSAEPGLRLLQSLRRIDRELHSIHEQLRALDAAD